MKNTGRMRRRNPTHDIRRIKINGRHLPNEPLEDRFLKISENPGFFIP